MKLKLTLLTLGLVTLSLRLPAGDKEWSLERCISYACENNLQVRQARVGVRQSDNNLRKHKLAFIPNFSAYSSYNMNWGRSVDLKDLTILNNTFSQNLSGALSASTYLVDGLSKHFSLKSGALDRDISIQGVEKLKDEISLQITRAYLQVLLSERLLQAARENLVSITGQRDRTRILYENGSQPYSSLLDMDSQVASEKVQVVSALGDLRKNMLTLMQLLDLRYDPDFMVCIPDSTVMEGYKSMARIEDIDMVYDAAGSLPRIREAELSLEKSRVELKAAKGRYYPTLSVTASYGSYMSSTSKGTDGRDYPFYDQVRNNVNPSVGLTLNIPIFNGWNTACQVRNARLDVESRELDLSLQRQDLYKEIQQAILDAGSYREKMEAAEANLESMRQTMIYTEGKFMAGALGSTDYIVARSNCFKAQSDYYQSLYQFVFQLKIIDFYKGIPIDL